ncbi:MAG: TldD/PmbA family protein [Candidatus Micrarchaeota archaeon]|nr:TldD/PmbA family protein [Candidatus Micrarchaeota archaeon]
MNFDMEKEIEILAEKTEKIMKKLKSEGANDVVLHAGIGNYQQTKFANNRIVKSDSSISKSIYVFCNWKGRIVETTIKDTSEKGIKSAIEKINRYASHIPVNEKFEGIAEGPFKYKTTKYDKRIEECYNMHAETIEEAVNSAEEVGKVRNGGVFETSYSVDYLLTSEKCEAKSRDSSVYFSFRSIYDKESSGHKVYSARSVKNLNPSAIAKEAARFAMESKGEKKEVEGKMDVLFEPLPLAIILEHIADSASAFEVETGNSFLVNKLGKQVGSECFTLIDDPIYEDAFICSPYDSEGVPTKRKAIIERGVLKTYLHNTSTAKRYKTETTANAGLINPHPWNVVLQKGSCSLEKLIENVDYGIYVTNAWYMRFQNYFTGEFSILPRDATFLIKNGKIEAPIRNVRINSSLQEIMKNAELIGKKAEKIHSWEVHGSVIAPPALVRDINVTKPVSH